MAIATMVMAHVKFPFLGIYVNSSRASKKKWSCWLYTENYLAIRNYSSGPRFWGGFCCGYFPLLLSWFVWFTSYWVKTNGAPYIDCNYSNIHLQSSLISISSSLQRLIWHVPVIQAMFLQQSRCLLPRLEERYHNWNALCAALQCGNIWQQTLIDRQAHVFVKRPRSLSQNLSSVLFLAAERRQRTNSIGIKVLIAVATKGFISLDIKSCRALKGRTYSGGVYRLHLLRWRASQARNRMKQTALCILPDSCCSLLGLLSNRLDCYVFSGKTAWLSPTQGLYSRRQNTGWLGS
jgi:hypothetical protein